jgi:hypothetical protein
MMEGINHLRTFGLLLTQSPTKELCAINYTQRCRVPSGKMAPTLRTVVTNQCLYRAFGSNRIG